MSGTPRGVPGGVPGRSRGLLGENPRGTENTSSLLMLSVGATDWALGRFRSSGMVLGTTLGRGNAYISLVFICVFPMCVCFLCFVFILCYVIWFWSICKKHDRDDFET